MRAALVAIFVFAALLASGHYVGAPFFCRGGITIPGLDANALCGPDQHFNRAGSVLLYFSAIATAVVFGVIAALLQGKAPAAKTAEENKAAKPVETFEEIVASAEKKEGQVSVAADSKADEKPKAEIKTAASTDGVKAAPEVKLDPEKRPQEKAGEKSQEKADEKANDPLTAAIGDAIMAGLGAKKGGATKGFEGTNEELIERFRELKKQDGVNSIAQAQRLLDESTLSALTKGVDPKQHLSQIAHLVLAEDPDLKSGVVRGVVVHIAARLKELGVANQKLPGTAAKGAA